MLLSALLRNTNIFIFRIKDYRNYIRSYAILASFCILIDLNTPETLYKHKYMQIQYIPSKNTSFLFCLALWLNFANYWLFISVVVCREAKKWSKLSFFVSVLMHVAKWKGEKIIGFSSVMCVALSVLISVVV